MEIPECRRCCCCVPLRHGILVFGYINLIFSILVVALEAFVSVNYVSSYHTMALYKGVAFYSQIWFALILYTVEIVFNIVLLVGAHKKKIKLIRAYYYYGITTTLAHHQAPSHHQELYRQWAYFIVECCFVLSSLATVEFLPALLGITAFRAVAWWLPVGLILLAFGLQVYLLLLVRSELLKIRQSTRLCYVNHAAEVMVDTPLQVGRNPF